MKTANFVSINLFLLLSLALIISPAFAQDLNYRQIQLAYGISLEIPSNWEILSQDAKQNLAAASEAMISNAGETVDGVNKERLLAVSAKPIPSGAKIRVSVTKPPEYTQADLAAATAAELNQLQPEFHAKFQKIMASSGIKILNFQTPRIEQLNNRLAFVMEYTRTDPNGTTPWLVTQYQVPISNRRIDFTLSHRLSDAIIWKPILEYVKRSIRF